MVVSVGMRDEVMLLVMLGLAAVFCWSGRYFQEHIRNDSEKVLLSSSI